MLGPRWAKGKLRTKVPGVVGVLGIIIDSSSLITACKFHVDGLPVIGHLLTVCQITIVPAVRDEVALAGSVFADAAVAKNLMDTGRVQVNTPTVLQSSVLDYYRLGTGEKQSILLAKEQTDDLSRLVVDDRLAFIVCSRVGLRPLLLLDLMVELVGKGHLSQQLADKMANSVTSRYAPGFVFHTQRMLEWGDRTCLK